VFIDKRNLTKKYVRKDTMWLSFYCSAAQPYPWLLTFSTENWLSVYSCPGNVHASFDFLSTCFCELEIRTGRTDKQTKGQTPV